MVVKNNNNKNLSRKAVNSLDHSVSYEGHPCVALLFGASVDLVHFRPTHGVRTDNIQAFILMGHFSHDHSLKGDHWWFVILYGR